MAKRASTMFNTALFILSWAPHAQLLPNAETPKEATFSLRPRTLSTSPSRVAPSINSRKCPCTARDCAVACLQGEACTSFSHSPSDGACVLTYRHDELTVDYDVTHSDWDTYYKECPLSKGYVLYSNHTPPLCFKFDPRKVNHQEADELCREEGSRLARVKTLVIYSLVKHLLDAHGYTEWVYVGADDRTVEGSFYWNDGRRLAQEAPVWEHTNRWPVNHHEDCTALKSSARIIDTDCTKFPTAFLCQYDI